MSRLIYTMPIPFGPARCQAQDENGQPFSGVLAQVEQYVTAYRVEQEALLGLLPPGYRSLRPVLRLNVELLTQVQWLAGRAVHRVELVTPVEYRGKKGWLNLVTWEDDVDSVLAGRDIYGIPKCFAQMEIRREGEELTLTARDHGFPFLTIAFHRAGVQGGCPKEADNEGTFYPRWLPNVEDRGKADVDYTSFIGVETIEEGKEYCDCRFTWRQPTFQEMPAQYAMVEAICAVPCQEILGAYAVSFPRTKNDEDQVIL